ncbi:hypothetical protein HK405_008453, partial [Cladochytrium tenue]
MGLDDSSKLSGGQAGGNAAMKPGSDLKRPLLAGGSLDLFSDGDDHIVSSIKARGGGGFPFTLSFDGLRGWSRHQFNNLREGLKKSIAPDGNLAPVINLLAGSQLEACLLAFLPAYLNLKSGSIVVDMFLITLIVTAVMALVRAAGAMAKGLIEDEGAKKDDKTISVKVEFHRIGQYGQVTNNIHWTALAWLISRLSRNQTTGEFRMAPFESDSADRSDDEDGEGFNMPDFNILPRGDSDLEIEHEGAKFIVYFEQQTDQSSDEEKKKRSEESSLINQEPPIVIRRCDDEPVDLDWMQRFLVRVTTMFLKHEEKKRSRARYERHQTYNYWRRVQSLRATRGLSSVALDKTQEELLLRDLETFHKDAGFYKRMGLPYRRGYLFSGRPGTGKTSLINAISSTYNRDLYYLNLRDIRDDNALQSAFSSVPKNSIIVFEDIDAQSGEVHSRERRFAFRRMERLRDTQEREARKSAEKKKKEKERKKKLKIKELKRLKKERAAQKKKEKKEKKKEKGEDDDADDESESGSESEINEDEVE